jgi:GNAT superfamily N-acetyltransferase
MTLLTVVKIDKNNIDTYCRRMTTTMYQEYVSTYNHDVSKCEYIEHLTTHILQYTYILVWRQSPTSKERLLGYFSLSPSDLVKPDTFLSHIYNKLTMTYYLFDVYVFPSFRGKGIGKYLVRKAIEVAHQSYNAKYIRLYTLTDDLQQFYHKNAFVSVGHYVIDGTKMHVMEKKCI